jgi:hypothetical protein
MAYLVNYPAAARRHLSAADRLKPTDRRDVAGYLYGIAAECAIKAMMRDAGLRPTGRRDGNDPFYAHFPELKTLLRDTLGSRRLPTLTAYTQSEAFMKNWAIRMRYSNGRDITDRWVSRWATDANQAVSSIGT